MSPTPLLSQQQAIDRWPALCEYRLNEARRLKQIQWVRGKKQKPFYTEAAIEAFISEHLTKRCEDITPAPPRIITKFKPKRGDLSQHKELLDIAADRRAERI